MPGSPLIDPAARGSSQTGVQNAQNEANGNRRVTFWLQRSSVRWLRPFQGGEEGRGWREGKKGGGGGGGGGGMVQKRVTAQGWLGSTPEGQRPQIRGLRAGGSLVVASSIPATQLSSPARLAERVVTPHAPMTLGANHVSRGQKGGDPAASGDLRLGHRAPGRGGRRASIPLHALTTLLSVLGALGLFEPRGARICPGNFIHLFR